MVKKTESVGFCRVKILGIQTLSNVHQSVLILHLELFYVDLAYLRAFSKLLMALIFSPIWPIFGKVDKNLSKKSCIRKIHHENN